MKKTNLVCQIVLALAVIVLYVLFFTKPSCSKAPAIPAGDSTAACCQLPVAYINIDTLLTDYLYSQDLNEQLLRKRENAQANYNQKARQFEKEAAEFQRKLENNAFLSQQRAQSEQERLIKKQQDLQALDQQLSTELAQEMQRMNEQLQDSIYNYLGIYNKEKAYHLIFSNTGKDNIMIGAEAYDITAEIVEGLNNRYQAPAKKKK